MAPDTEDQVGDEELSDAVAEALRALPKPVQDFVTGPERARIATTLSQKYGLHVDQSGVFDVAFIHMLLGVSTPEEFTKTLADTGIAPTVVASLAADVNEQVFIPLRKAEQAVSSAPAAVAPVPLAPRLVAVSAPMLQPSQPFTPTLPAEAIRNTPGPAAPVTASVPQATATPLYAPPQPAYPYPMQANPQYTGQQMPYVPYGYPQPQYLMPGQPVYMPQYQAMNWQVPPQAVLPPQSWAHIPAPESVPPTTGQPIPLPTHAYQPPPAPEAPRIQAPAQAYERPVMPVPAALTEAREPQALARPAAAPARITPEPVSGTNLPPLTKNYGSDPYREPV